MTVIEADRSGQVKIVYEDNKVTKVLKGLVVAEDEFTLTVKAETTNARITIGKRAIVKVCETGEFQHD